MAVSEQPRMASAALRHPIRVRLLEAMNLGSEVSATSFVNEGLGEDIDSLRSKTGKQQVSLVDHHLKELARANCVYVAEKKRRRGVPETFYRANAVAYFSDDEWAEMDLDRRREISRVMAQGLIVQIEGAMIADTFDSRSNRWLVYEPLKLDERGWDEVISAIAEAHAKVVRVSREAVERLGDRKPLRATFGVVAFESPAFPGDDAAAPDDRS